MPDAFDPYHKWLGIPPPEQPPDHYRLLGVKRLETDPDVIANAADQRMAHVRTFQTGRYGDLAARLLNELASARLCLLNPERKAAYDRSLKVDRSGGAAQVPVKPATEPATRPDAVATAALGFDPHEATSTSAARSRRSQTKTSPHKLLVPALVGGGLLGLALAVAALYWYSQFNSAGIDGQDHKPLAKRPDQRKVENGADKSKPADRPDAADATTAEVNEPKHPDAGTPDEHSPPDDKAVVEAANPAVETALSAVRKTLARRDPASAKNQLAQCDKLLASPHQKAEIARLRKIAELLTDFWESARGQLAELQAGDEIVLDDVPLGIVSQAGRNSLTLRMGRQSKTFPFSRLPIDVALALGQRVWPPDKPEAQAAIGAFLAMEPGGDRQQARSLWQTADTAGQHTADLLAELDIPLPAGIPPAPKLALDTPPPKPAPHVHDSAAVDLLKLIDPKRDAVNGAWTKDKQNLITPSVDGGRLQIPCAVPEEYDLTAVVERLAGNESLNFGIVVGRSQTMIVFDADRGTIVALHLLDGKFFDGNQTTRRQPLVLTMGKTHAIAIEVRKNRVKALCDGRAMIDWTGDAGRLSIESARWSVPKRDQLFLGVWSPSSFRISKLELKPVGAAVAAQPATIAVNDAVSPPPTAADGAAKLAVPDADKRQATLQVVKDLFKDDYANTKTPERKFALAKKLFEHGRDTKDDPVARYVLLIEAGRLAAQVGDSEAVVQSIAALAESFEIDQLEMVASALAKTEEATAPGNLKKKLAENALLWMDQAVEVKDFKRADRLAIVAKKATVKSSDAALAKQVTATVAKMRELKTAYENAEVAFKTLEEHPDDPEANLAAGRFYSFIQRDWEQGLPHLAKGSDAALKKLAEQEAAPPTEAAAQMKLGDGWWELAHPDGGATPENQDKLLERAGHWYRQAVEQLTGLQRTKVEKRLATIGDQPAAAAGDAVAKGKWIDALKLVDVARHRVRGDWNRTGSDLKFRGASMLSVPIAPDGSYTLEAEFTRTESDDTVIVVFPVGTKNCGLELSGFRGNVSRLAFNNGASLADVQPGTLQNNHRYKLTINVDGAGDETRIAVELDGKPYVHWQGKAASLNYPAGLPDRAAIGIGGSNQTAAVFHALRVRSRSGSIKRLP